jgi:hypothetical protein
VTTTVNVPANGTTVVPFTWAARAGQRFVTVVLNASRSVTELDYTNDRATRAYVVNGTSTGPQISLDDSSAIDLSELVSDPATLVVSGSVRVGISTTASCTVSVFEDVDGDRAYDPEVDTLLGSSILPPSQSAADIQIPVQATVRFVPAHLMLYLDSTNSFAETDETNNFWDLSNRSCQTTAQTFAPVVKWRQGLVSYQMPTVARLMDTNGDAVIDDYDMPVVVAVTGNSVYAFRGDSGQIIWSASSGTTARQINPTIGDVDGDGKPEVLIHADRHRIVCLNGADGSVKWTSPELDIDPTWLSYFGLFRYAGSPVIADLDADKHPEIVSGRTVLNGANGTIKWVGTGGSGRSFPGVFNGVDYYMESFPDQEAPIAADLNLDGKLEVIAGNTAYRADGSILWQRTDIPDGAAAMWGRNVAHGKVYGLKPDGTNLWTAPVAIPGGAILGGAPTVINVTQGATGPVVAVTGDGKLSVFRASTGALIWTRDVTTNFDRQATTTTNGIAGFYSFGSANLAYVSNQSLYVFNAWNGTQIFKRSGGTSPYYPGMPAFADVDGDGVGELIINGENGLEVLSEPTWNSTRSVFNEFSYHETNVSDDHGTIPAPEPASGNYRVATDFGLKARALPNFTASYPRVDMRQYPASVTMTVRVGNNGWAATPASTVTFYRVVAGSATAVKLDTVPVAEIAAGAYRDVTTTLANPAAADLSFYAIVNEQAPVIGECNTTDNKSPLYTVAVSRDIAIDSASPTISDPRPSRNDVVTLAASARYSGAVDGSTPVRAQFFLGDPATGGTAISPLLDVPMTSSYQQYAGGVSFQWTVTAAVGGQTVYVVFDPENILTESNESNNKAFVLLDVGPSEPQPKLTSTLILSPAAAEAGKPIQVRALAQNTGNVKLENVTVRWTATGANTGQTFNGSAPFASLAKNAVTELTLGSFTPASDDTYTVSVNLSDAAIASVSTPKTIVIGRFVGVELTAVPTRVPLSLPLVQCHARVTRTNTAAVSDDPLLPLIKAHLQQGITWEMRTIANDLGCFKCHVQSLALVNFSSAQRIPGIVVDSNVVDSVVKLILNEQNGDGHYGTKGGVVSTSGIGGWGLSTAHDTAGVTAAILKSADQLVASQSGTGYWAEDGVPAASYNRNEGTTMVAMPTVIAAYERTRDPRYLAAINRAVGWLTTTSYQPDATRRPYDAARIGIALVLAKPWISDPVAAAAATRRLDTIAAFVRAGQNADGSFSNWPTYQYPVMATAQCLYFLTLYGTPPTDPAIRNGAIWLMNVQQADGSWVRTDGSITDYRYDVSSWAMIALPAIIESFGTFTPDFHVTLPRSTSLVSATPPPTSRKSVAGGDDYVWRVAEPTESGTDIYVNLRLNALADGVTTPVASAANVTYDDPYSKSPISHSVAVPSVTGFSPVSVRVSTDAAAYGANAPVAITETIDNIGTTGANLTNTLAIVDGNGTTVATLAANDSLSDLPQVAFPGWHYSAPATLTVPATGPRFVQISADFGQQLAALGATGTFLPDSLRVSRDAAPSAELSFTFIHGTRPDAGTLVVAIPADVTTSTTAVHVFFDTASNGLKPRSAYDLDISKDGTGFWWTSAKLDEVHSQWNHASELVLLQPQTGSGRISTFELPYTGTIPSRAAVIYTADLVVPVTGTYTFTGRADFQFWIEIDGVEVLSARAQTTSTKTLTAGVHHVRITYYKWDTTGFIESSMTAPGGVAAPLGAGFFPTISGTATPLGSATVLATNVVTRTFTWNTGLSAAGAYKASATIRQDGGLAGRFDAPFTIGGATTVTATSTTDRTVYDSGDIAHVNAEIAYSSGNLVLRDLTATISALSPDGVTLASAPTPIASLTPGQTVNVKFDWTIASVPPGAYNGRVVLKDAAGATLATSSAPFTVRSSATTGKGITGTLASQPSVSQRSPLFFTAAVTNGGNASLTSASFRVDVVDAANAVVANVSFMVDALTGATATKQLALDTAPLAVGHWTALLVSLVSGSPLALASTTFDVTPPPVVTATLASDKQAYDLRDTAHITSTITYTSGPGVLANAAATITVTGGSTNTTTFASFAVGTAVTATVDQPITASMAPGDYTITVIVRDSNGTTLTQQTSTFTVISSAVSGKGISGALTSDATVVQGNPLHLTATITNNGNAALLNAPFSVTIGGDTIPFTANVAMGASATYPLTYATTSLAPASYTATLGTLATTTFTVTPIPTVITATATTDKQSYDLGDTAHVTSTITYASGPAALTNASATITITSGATKTTTFDTIAVGTTVNATVDQPIPSTTAPGDYTVTIIVRDSNGATLTQQTLTFTVISSAVSGKGITATLSADASVTQGNPLHLTATITNDGNVALVNAPFSVKIGGDTIPFTANVAMGASATYPLTFATNSLTPATYTATLGTLASTTFTVTPIPTVVTATAATDKPSYDLGDVAHITSTITYASGPATLTNATATITITSGATKTTTFDTIAVGATANATLDQSITSTMAPGDYGVTIIVRDATGATLTQQSVTFTVISSAVSGKGISGVLTADATVTQGNTLHLTATITNNGNAAIANAPFTVKIGSDTIPFTATVAMGATATIQLTYATTSLTPATYTATLASTITLATTTFIVTPIPTVVTATATTDKPSYDLGDTAHITSTITHTSGPAVLTNATATITVTGGATKTTTFPTITVGTTATATLDQPISASMTPSDYTVTVIVRDNNGTTLTQQTSTFTIVSSAVSGKGVTGALTADASVTQGNPLNLTATITNNGNAALTNASFVMNIVDPSTQHVIDTVPFTATVAAGLSVTRQLTFSATSPLGVQTYAATLLSRITPSAVQLAATTFAVKSAAQFALNVAAGTTPRVVIRTTCSTTPCTAAARPFLTRTLDAAGIPSVIVGDDTSLIAALRTGAFSAAIIDLAPAAEPKIADEYLELIRSGVGLLFIDDTSDANPKLAPALQTKFGGKLHGPLQLDLLATPFTTAGRITFNGDSSSLQLDGSLAAARITATQAPAITYATLGAGRVVVLPFNVEQTPNADVAKLITAATAYISRVPSTDARQVVPLEIDVTTPAGGGSIGVDVRVTLPAGMSVVAASPALTSPATTTWSFTASASGTTRLVLWVRLPETIGSYSINVSAGFSGQLANVTKAVTLAVTGDRASIENAAIARVTALQANAGAKYAKTLADVRAQLDTIRAANNFDAAAVDAIIAKLLTVINDLDSLTIDAAAARADTQRLLIYWQSRG